MKRIIRYQKACRAGMAAVITAGCLFVCSMAAYIWFFYRLTPQTMDSSEWLGAVVVLCMLGMGIAHLTVLYALWQDVQCGDRVSFLRSVCISLGVVSAIMLVGDAAALHDIGKQTLAGMNCGGEWTIIFSDNVIRAIFLVLAGISLGAARRGMGAESAEEEARDVVFVTVHEVGFVSAILAVGAVALGFLFPVLAPYRTHLVTLFTAIAIAPWGTMLLVWFVSRPRHKGSWWDEKQVSDMGRSALLALPVIGIVMLVLFIVSITVAGFDIPALWFPVLIITAVVSFSGLSAAFSRWG